MNKQRKLVVYVGPYGFPDGGAAARRIYGNCLSLRNAGYDVIVTSGQVSDSVEQEYDGIPVISLSERRHEHLPTILKHLMYFSAGKSTIRWLDSLAQKPAAVILYSGYSPYLIKLLPWSKKNNVKLIFDVVEWYDPPGMLSRLLSPYYMNIELAMRFLIKKCDGLIVISNYLKSYYSPYLNNIIKVPPTADLPHFSDPRGSSVDLPISFVYAGTPGKKDALPSIISALLIAHSNGDRVELHIAGVPEDKLGEFLPLHAYGQEAINKVVKCHGILSHEDTLNLVGRSDYSILLRPNIRSVQAGFPTKFVESMALGTPVIANLTSDLGAYLKDGINGFVCPDSTVHSLVEVINRSVNMRQDDTMRVSAKETAANYFAPEKYAGDFLRLIG
ncbi:MULTISPECIES: glycosyltransferase [Marinobacter]|uniref:glycosyltransferase n=1 Tax=Marinobacter TaxID=2742 RepID=UPI0012459326|nr:MULTISPECIES: glycosyltransferase [Marinobacter]MBL3554920.1 glycosyltransferase [Marinobacter sp. JB05H06]